MIKWWQLWQSHLSPESCREIIQKALVIPPQEAVVGFDKNIRKEDSFRRSRVRWVDRRAEEWSWIVSLIEHTVRVSNRDVFGFDLEYLHEIQFTEYDSSYKGMYHWHEDLEWLSPKPYHRKLSFILQLSHPQAYEGGQIEFQIPDQTTPEPAGLTKQGSILIFPSFIKHRVTPVTKGKRYSLVAWYEGPPFR